MPYDKDARFQRKEKGPLDRFKNQNLLLRKFRGDGLKLYSALGSEKTTGELLAETGMKEEQLTNIIEFMEQNGILIISAGLAAPEAAPSSAPPVSEASIAPAQPSEELAPIAPKPFEKAGRIEPGGISPIAPATSEGEISSITPVAPSVQKAKEEAAPRAPTAPSAPQAPIAPSEKKEEAPKFDADAVGLSPLEKIIYSRYGKTGVKVYNLIDGEKTAEEILVETGISEVQLVEILEFMDNQGIIKLEKPEEQKPGAAESQPSEEFKPMIEEAPGSLASEAEIGSGEFVDIVPIDVPAKANPSMMQNLENKGRVLAKFGKVGSSVYEMVDGKKDLVDLASAARLSFYDLDMILGFLGKRGAILFRPLTRDEVKKKYGEDAFTIYKRYGRDGILLYELIGKEASLKDIILGSRIEPERAVEIFMFIHQVLGLEIPFDKKLIYKQLGLS